MNPEIRKVLRDTTSPRLVTTLRLGKVTGAVRMLFEPFARSSSLSSLLAAVLEEIFGEH